MSQRAGLHHVRSSRFVPAAVEQAVNSALSRGPGYEPTPLGTAYEVSAVRGYYIDFSSKTRSPAASDTDTILSAPLAQLALGWWERSVSGEDRAVDDFLRICKLLEERAQARDGELRWPEPLPAPKYGVGPGASSALTQGQAASVFVRAYLASGDERFARSAQSAVAPLLSERSTGLVSQTAVGPVLEETPSVPPSHILNGWISGLWGVRDVQIGLSDERAARAFEDGVESLRRHLPAYDTGWWSRYSLFPHVLEDLAKPIYHRYHVDQLRAMYDLSGVSEFREMADRWATFDRRSHVVRAVMQKGVFAMIEIPRRRRWLAEHPPS
jgi:hypothetical protein